MGAHIHLEADEVDALVLQAHALVEGEFAAEQDAAVSADDALPGDAGPGLVQRPGDLAGGAGITGGIGDVSVGGDLAPGNAADDGEHAVEHGFGVFRLGRCGHRFVTSWLQTGKREDVPLILSHMSHRVFLLEDDAEISALVKMNLEAAGLEVAAFRTATGFVSYAEEFKPGLFLLDIMVPGGDGRDICREIRASKHLAHVPVVFLTARVREEDKVFGLEQGADDYITKPFSPREMVARVKAVLRRFERPLTEAVVQAGAIEIDPVAMVVTVRGEQIPTTATEFRLLDFFARNAGRVFTRDRLLDAVWRDTAFVTPRSVDVYVRRLREKIEANAEEPEYIRTVRGIGYKFEAPR